MMSDRIGMNFIKENNVVKIVFINILIRYVYISIDFLSRYFFLTLFYRNIKHLLNKVSKIAISFLLCKLDDFSGKSSFFTITFY